MHCSLQYHHNHYHNYHHDDHHDDDDDDDVVVDDDDNDDDDEYDDTLDLSLTGWDLPGNYGFDPLRLGVLLCPNAADKLLMQSAEILSGRTAMLATVGFVVQEYVTGLPVVRETPQFFYFLGQSM